MFILLYGVLTFSGMAVFANKVGLQSQIRSATVSLAANQLSTLQTTTFTNLKAIAPTTFDIPTEFVSQLPGSSNTKYQVTGTYQIQDISNTKKKVTVQIKWRNASAPESNAVKPWSNVRLATIVTKPGSITAN